MSKCFYSLQDGLGGYECECGVGWTGDRCQVNIDECVSAPCQNGGTCFVSQCVMFPVPVANLCMMLRSKNPSEVRLRTSSCCFSIGNECGFCCNHGPPGAASSVASIDTPV